VSAVPVLAKCVTALVLILPACVTIRKSRQSAATADASPTAGGSPTEDVSSTAGPNQSVLWTAYLADIPAAVAMVSRRPPST
jgi:hypothetical protein